MYTPRAFALDDLPELQQLIQHTRLAQVVTVGEHGLLASHLPLLLNPNEGPNGTLYGHMAKANPQWHDLQNGGEALVIFAGADAYVSPAFYPSKAEHGKVVPTWNYLAVHAYGTADGYVVSGGRRERVPVDKRELATVARESGGEAFSAGSDAELRQVYQGIARSVGYQQVEREVTEQYAGYALAFALLASLAVISLAARWP